MSRLYENEHIVGIVSFVSLTVFFIVKTVLFAKPTGNKRVTVVGLTCLDIHACPVDCLPADGGVSFIKDIHISLAGTAGGTAVSIAKLVGGNNVDFYGSIGDDYVGKLIIDLLNTFGIDPCYLQKQKGIPTSATIINVRTNGDRPCLHRLGASDYLHLSSRDIQRICHSTDIIHIGGTSLLPGMPSARTLKPFLEAVNTYNDRITVIMDLIAPHAETLQTLESLLPYVDYFMPSLEEAEMISGCNGPIACGQYFINKLRVKKACIFKAGESGSFIISYHPNHDSSNTHSTSSSISSSSSSGYHHYKMKQMIGHQIFAGFPQESECGEEEFLWDLSVMGIDDEESIEIVGNSQHNSMLPTTTIITTTTTTSPTTSSPSPIRFNHNTINTSSNSNFRCCRIPAFPVDVIPECIIELIAAKTASSSSSIRGVGVGGVVDTTGCGDNYCAGFIAGLFHDMSVYESCRLGTATAALCATGVGSDAGNIDLELAQSFIKAHDHRLKQIAQDLKQKQQKIEQDTNNMTTTTSTTTSNEINHNHHHHHHQNVNDKDYQELLERKAEFENAIKERDFYLEKLSEIEFMLQQQQQSQSQLSQSQQQSQQHQSHLESESEVRGEDEEDNRMASAIFKVLYATKEGFGIDHNVNNSISVDDDDDDDDDEKKDER